MLNTSFWSKVNKYTQTPVNAVWLVVIFCSCLNLIGIGSTLTIVAIFNITAPALDLSYIAVIIAHRVYEHRVQFIEGPFTLGKWSRPINTVACTWVLFISVVLFFPTTKPVTALNMNYAICVAGFIALFSMTWWFVGARKYVGSALPPFLNPCILTLWLAGNTPAPARKTSSTCFLRKIRKTSCQTTDAEASASETKPKMTSFLPHTYFAPAWLGVLVVASGAVSYASWN